MPDELRSTMPPKKPFSAERAQEFGKLAVVKTTESFGKDGLPAAAVLDCAYRGIATHDGGVDNAVPITAEATLVYDWRFTCEGFEETREMKVQCRNASKQGVHFPTTRHEPTSLSRLRRPGQVKMLMRHL